MACLVNRNSENRVMSVKRENGERSKLYDSLRENVLVPDGETALEVYKSSLTPEIEAEFDGAEPKLFYRSSTNQVFDNLTELAISDGSSNAIQLGFYNESTETFYPVMSVNMDESNSSKYLMSMVKNGMLSETKKVMPDGKTRYQGKGSYTATKNLNSLFASMELRGLLGEGRYDINPEDGTIGIEFGQELTAARMADGTQRVIRIADIQEFLKNNKDVVNKADLAFEYVNKIDKVRPVDSGTSASAKSRRPVSEIEKSLTQMLKSLGFTTTSLDAYRESYNTRYGKNPDIEAIADITNRVVALAEDGNHSENISEEMAHVAIELYKDQASIEAALAVIHRSAEYQVYEAEYRKAYAPFYSGTELEMQVRKEVLGKALKRAVIDRFNTANQNEAEVDITSRLRQIWDRFVKFIIDRIKPSHMRIMDNLNEELAESIFNNDTSKFTDTPTSEEAFYYSIMDKPFQKTHNQLVVAQKLIQDHYRKVLKQEAPNQAEIEALLSDLNENSAVSALNTVVGTVASQIALVESEINAQREGEVLSQKAINIAHVLNETLVPLLNEIRSSVSKAEIKNESNTKRLNSLSEQVDEVNKRIAAIRPELTRDNERYVSKAVQKIVELDVLNEKEMEEFRSTIEGGIKDTTWLGKMFGLASHSKNPLIQMIGQRVNEINQRVRRKFNDKLNSELSDIDSKGLGKFQKDIIKKGSMYYLSPFLWDKFNKDLETQRELIASKLSDKSVEEIQKLKNKDKNFRYANILGDVEFVQFKKEVKAWRDSKTERRNTDAHYAARDTRYETAKVSDLTRDYIAKKNSSMYSINRKYQNKDGTVDKSKMSETDKTALRTVKEAHAFRKSPYDSVGQLKEGLEKINISEATQAQLDRLPFELDSSYTGDIIIPKEGIELDDLNIESRMAVDMFNLNMLYRKELSENSKTNNPLAKFTDTIAALEADGISAYDWATSNATIGLTSEFYESLGEGTGFVEVAENYINGLSGNSAVTKGRLLKEYKRLQSVKKDIMKQNRKSGNFLEADAFHMTVQTKARLLELDEEVSTIKRQLGIPKELLQRQNEELSESDLTDDFHKMLADSNLSTFDFALKHMTDRNAVRVKSFAMEIEDYYNGHQTHIKSNHAKFLQELTDSGKFNGVATIEERLQIAKDEYAKRSVASYFKRFQPKGYSEAISDLKSGKISMAEFINNRDKVVSENPALKFVEITPDYTWSEDINNGEFLNPNYKEGVPFTPKMSEYLDKSFFSEFGIKESDYRALESDDLSLLKPTKNVDKFELLTKMVGLREESTKLYGDDGVVNKYLRPQMSASVMEKIQRSPGVLLGKTNNLKDTVTDLFQSKIDEKDYGEEVGGMIGTDVGVKVIPKYFQSELDSAELLSDNVLQAALMDYEAALRYQERVSAERELKAYEDKIANQKLIDNGASTRFNKIFKKSGASHYSEKAQEMLDHHLYGIRQNRKLKVDVAGKEIDLTQVFSKFNNYVRFTNLAYNPIVDATSYTTGVYNNLLDRFAGDYYGAEANQKATKQLLTMIPKYMAETGKMSKKSDFAHLTEFFGVLDSEDRIKESSRGRVMRALSKSAYGISKVANLGVTPKIMLATLHDHKFVDGQFRSYNAFKKKQKEAKPDMKEAEIKAIWNANQDTLFENIKIDPDKGVSFNEKFSAKYPENTTEVFDELTSRVSNKIAQVIQSVDSMTSVSDQTAAQRDVLTNALLMHRSWLMINFTRKFKGRHFNIATGQIDEGHYRSLVRGVANLVKNKRKGVSFKETMDSMEEHEIRNMRRGAADSIGVMLLAAIATGLLAFDDDDDTAIENFAQLIALRTVSESQSANAIGMFDSALDVHDTPLIQMNIYDKVKKGLTDTDRTKDGRKKEDRSVEYFIKATPFKRGYQMGDLDGQVKAFRHFNRGTLWLVPEE